MPTSRRYGAAVRITAITIAMLVACSDSNNSNPNVDAGPDQPPAGWTCDPLAYDDGHVCHCACGVPDPDCGGSLPITGCTNDEICTPEGTCTSCGNAVVDNGEACDAALPTKTECGPLGYQPGQVGCKASCEWAYNECTPLVTCGNGQLDAAELCEGTSIQPGLDCMDYGRVSGSLACNAGCAIISSGCYTCGDGKIEAVEACDDFGTTSGNGCSSTCAVETGFQCTGMPSTCAAICGDGMIKGNETCDDGDAFGNDGCSATCQIEQDCTCAGAPSTCSCATVQVIATKTNYVYFDTASLILDGNGQPFVSWVFGIDYTEPVTNYLKEHTHVMFSEKPATAWTSTELLTWDQTITSFDNGEFWLAYDGGIMRQLVHRIYHPQGTWGVGTKSGATWTFAYGNPHYIFDATRGGGEWHMLASNTANNSYRYQSGEPGALTRDESIDGIFQGYELRIQTSSTNDVYITSLLPNSGHTSYNLKVLKRENATTWSTVYDVATTGTCVYPVEHIPLRMPNGAMMFFEDGFNGTQRWLKAHRFNGTSWVVETVADLSYRSFTCGAGGTSYSYAYPVTAVDQLGRPHVLVVGGPDNTSTTIKDYYRTATGWQSRSFPLTRAKPFQMLIDANGATHIVAAAANGTDFGNSRLVYMRIDENAWQ